MVFTVTLYNDLMMPVDELSGSDDDVFSFINDYVPENEAGQEVDDALDALWSESYIVTKYVNLSEKYTIGVSKLR